MAYGNLECLRYKRVHSVLSPQWSYEIIPLASHTKSN